MSSGTSSPSGSESVWQPVRMRLICCAIPLALALTACSGTAHTSLPVSTGTPVPTVTTTSPTPSTSATPSPTPSPSTSSGRARPALDGDVDGDGKPDSVRTSASLVTVELTGMGTTVTAPVHGEGPNRPAVLGSKDVDRDGFAELFLETAQGASTSFATPYRFDGKALHELQLDGGPARLGIGGSVMHGDGFRCLPSGLLEVRSADSTDGSSFTVHLDLYRLAATQLVLVSTTTVKAKQGDPAVEESYRVSCGSVGEGG